MSLLEIRTKVDPRLTACEVRPAMGQGITHIPKLASEVTEDVRHLEDYFQNFLAQETIVTQRSVAPTHTCRKSQGCQEAATDHSLELEVFEADGAGVALHDVEALCNELADDLERAIEPMHTHGHLHLLFLP